MPQKEARRAELDASIERAQERIAELEAQLPELTTAEGKAWDEYENSDRHANGKEYAAWLQASEARHRIVMSNLGYYDWVAALRDQIKALDHPIVAQKEAAKEARLQNLRRKTKMAKQTAKDRGVPDEYLAESGNFYPGGDARYKSDLINSVLLSEGLVKDMPKDAKMQFDPKDAVARLEEREWTGASATTDFLAKSRDSRAEKAEKREAAAAEKAEAKAAKEAEAAQAKADKAAQAEVNKNKAETGQVAPDPKPARSKGGMK